MNETIIKVLLIEDDKDDSLFLQDLLSDAKRARFSIDAVFTGKEGLVSAQKNRYDVVLLDYRLPDADGLELLQQIQREQLRVPVVMVTSHGDRHLQTRALEFGAIEYLEKGAITADLLERTCIYANGLVQATLGRFPEFKILIDQAASNSKGILNAHRELTELRSETNLKLDRLLNQHREQVTERTAQHTELLTAVKNLAKFRWTLDWVAEHRTTALILFICFLLAAVAAAVLIQTLDLEVLRKLIELKKGASLSPELMGDPGWFLS